MILGIDLGTTYSAAAYLDEYGKPQIVTNIDGDRTTPSVVMVEGDHVIVGKIAKRKSLLNALNICSRVKSMMGRKRTAITNGAEQYSPEMVSHFILKKIIQDAEKKLGESITGIVVTVPANYSDAQRQSTIDAVHFTGVDLIGMVDEPTAAALYYHSIDAIEQGTVLVYDFGGGTCDVTLMQVNGDNIRILQKTGAPETGGIYFDDFILEIVMEKVKENFGIDLKEEQYKAVRQDILNDAEECKKELSARESSSIVVRADNLREDIEVTRGEFEKRISKMFKRTRSLIDEVLMNEGMEPEEVDKILLVGGSSQIPYVQRNLEKYFGKELSYEVNPNEAVALGAAIYANLCAKEKETSVHFEDVCSHGIGIVLNRENSLEQYNDVIIRPSTRIPTQISRTYGTGIENQRLIHLTVTEGETEELDFVRTIAENDINLPAGLPKNTQVEVTIALDEKQMVHLYIKIPARALNFEFAIKRESNYSEEELQMMSGLVASKNVE